MQKLPKAFGRTENLEPIQAQCIDHGGLVSEAQPVENATSIIDEQNGR